MNSNFIIYLALINVFTFIIFGIDKKRAKQKRWRIPEAFLFLLSIAGGSFGGITGMCIFRHKTKKFSFILGLPVIFLAEFAYIFFYIYR